MKVFVLGDVHFPYVSWRALDACLVAIKECKPDVVIQVGDLYDLYSWSKFPRSHGVTTPHQELLRARNGAERMWSLVSKASPKSKLIQILGNHDVRPHKRVLESAPEIEPLLGLKEIFEFEKVETVHDGDGIVLDGVYYEHGYRKFGDHVKHNKISTVCGHLHLGGVSFMRLGKKTLFELNVGYLANPYSSPMSYAKQRRFATWTWGFGIVEDRVPKFVPIQER